MSPGEEVPKSRNGYHAFIVLDMKQIIMKRLNSSQFLSTRIRNPDYFTVDCFGF